MDGFIIKYLEKKAGKIIFKSDYKIAVSLFNKKIK